MLTRSLTAIALVATLALPSCKKDQAKPTPGQGDAAKPVATAPSDAQPPSPAPDDGGSDAVAQDAATAAATTTADAGASRAQPPDDKDALTNIKVLPKSWDKAKVVAYMKTDVSKGLGVKCSFCHVKDDFVSDDNEHKGAARKMITMTLDANKKYFGGKAKVSCMTCHNGKEEPPQ